MKFWNAGGGKAEDIIHVVKNAESIKIPTGTPVVYAMNGTDDGLAVILPASSSAAKLAAFMAGVTIHDIEPGKMENIQVYGFNRRTNVVRGTRAASTDSWPAGPALSIGAVLTVNSTANGFDQGATIAATAANIQPVAVVAEACYSS